MGFDLMHNVSTKDGLLALTMLGRDGLVGAPPGGLLSAPGVSLLLLAVCVLLLWDLHRGAQTDRSPRRPLPPGSMGLPLIGETLSFILQGADFTRKRQRQYGNVFKTHILGQPTVRVLGSDNVRRVLHSEHTLVTVQWPKSTQLLLGQGALSQSPVHLHKLRRKAVRRAFSHSALTGYTPIIQEIIQSYISDWCTRGDVMGCMESRRLMFTVSSRALLGLDFTAAQTDDLLGVFDAFSGNVLSLPFNLPGMGLFKGLRAKRHLLAQVDTSIEKRRAGGERVPGCDALSILLEQNDDKALTHDELLESALELIFAGLESTSSAATSLLWFLWQQPHVFTKLHAELHDHGLADVGEGDLDLEKLNKLSYVNDIVKELLRIMPPIGGGFRTVLKDFELQGYHIPAGWAVMYGIRDTHTIADSFDDKETFDPDRWQYVNDKKVKRDVEYLPFGAGSRTCAGKEFARLVLRVLVVELARSCTWKPVKEHMGFTYYPVPRPKNGLPLAFSRLEAFRRRATTL